MRLDERAVVLLEQAAILHDIGKIGVPDAILLKPGRLEPEEVELMQKHCGYGKRRSFRPMTPDEFRAIRAHDPGRQIIKPCRAPVLDLAATASP